MIGLDTNVLVRYFAQDDDVQSAKASVLIESLSSDSPGYVSQIALIETVWVMARAYGADREQITSIIETMLTLKELVVESTATVRRAVRLYSTSKADFADCLIERSGAAAECEYTATFDVKAAKTAGLRLLK